MQHLRANTQVIVRVGSFVDAADGVTPETGVTLGAADQAELIKHGSTSVVDISAATWAAITNMDGWYALTLTTSHTDTEGQLEVVVQDSSVCLPVVVRFNVLAEAAWDSLYVAKDDGFMDVNIKTIGRTDTTETEASNLEAACSAYSATRGLSGTALPAAAADAAGGLPISDAGGLDLDARLDAAISSRMATYTQPTGFLAATFPGTVASTTNITAGTITTATNLTNAPTAGDLTATMKTSVNAEVLDVLSTDTFAELGAVPAATSSLKDKLTYLFMWARNKSTQTATTRLLKADDTTTTVATETVSDDGTTFTKNEAS